MNWYRRAQEMPEEDILYDVLSDMGAYDRSEEWLQGNLGDKLKWYGIDYEQGKKEAIEKAIDIVGGDFLHSLSDEERATIVLLCSCLRYDSNLDTKRLMSLHFLRAMRLFVMRYTKGSASLINAWRMYEDLRDKGIKKGYPIEATHPGAVAADILKQVAGLPS